MSAVARWHQYGYRLADGTEEWSQWGGWEWDGSNSGYWLPGRYLPEGKEAATIYGVLDKSGLEGVVIRRLVTLTKGATEAVGRP